MDLHEVAAHFSNAEKNGQGYKALCPLHSDTKPSLFINEGGDGRILVHCHGGCQTAHVLDAVGLTFPDLSKRPRIVATYDYRDKSGKLLFQSVRYDPKDFRQRTPKPGGWSWSIKGVKSVPYRLPELMKSKGVVFIVEGEKDAEALAKLGLTATTNAAGAGKWLEEFAEYFKGRDVVIIRDNDEAGKKHGQDVAQKLRNSAKSIKLLDLPGLPEKGDTSDWLAMSRRNDKKALLTLAAKTPEWEGDPQQDEESLMPVPFLQLVKRHPDLREPIVDCIARAGETVNVVAPSKVGKSWLAWGLALSVANGEPWMGRYATKQGLVLFIDNELHVETICHRGVMVAEAMELATEGIDVLSLRGRMISYKELRSRIDMTKPYTAVIVDSHYRMMPEGVNENDNSGVKDVYNWIDQLAMDMEAAWFLVHHSSKGDQSEKGVTDVGAGAGSQARATDTHLVMRKHVEEDAYVLEAAVRSFKPLAPLVMRWEFPVWVPDASLDPMKLENKETKARQKKDEDAKRDLAKAIAKEGPATANTLRRKLAMGEARCQRLLDAMVKSGTLRRTKAMASGNPTAVYALATGEKR